MIMGEPIIVYSSNPVQSSNAVLSLVSILAPLSYGGDFRPYLSVDNSEFQEFTKINSVCIISNCLIF